MHNKFRNKYHLPGLKSDIKLAIKAKECLKTMLLKDLLPRDHPCKPEKDGQGENIYEITQGSTIYPSLKFFKIAVKKW